jgi:hypothetical protein
MADVVLCKSSVGWQEMLDDGVEVRFAASTYDASQSGWMLL